MNWNSIKMKLIDALEDMPRYIWYVGYFVLRNIGIYRQRLALICAIVGIIAFIDIPIIFASVNFWIYRHFPTSSSHWKYLFWISKIIRIKFRLSIEYI